MVSTSRQGARITVGASLLAAVPAALLAYWGLGGTKLRWFTLLEHDPQNMEWRGLFLAAALASLLLFLLPLSLRLANARARRPLQWLALLAGVLLLVRGGLGLIYFAPRLFDIVDLLDFSQYSREAAQESISLDKIPISFWVWHLFLCSVWAIAWGLTLIKLGLPPSEQAIPEGREPPDSRAD